MPTTMSISTAQNSSAGAAGRTFEITIAKQAGWLGSFHQAQSFLQGCTRKIALGRLGMRPAAAAVRGSTKRVPPGRG